MLTMAVLGPQPWAKEYRAAAAAARSVRLVAAGDGLAQAAMVATPLPQRGTRAAEMLHAGRHVLIEPPIAATYEEFDRMVEEANRADLRIGAVYPLHFCPACIRAREIVELRRLGRVTGVRIAVEAKHEPRRGYLGPAVELLDAARWIRSGSPVTVAAPRNIEAAPATSAGPVSLLVTLGATQVTCSTGNGPNPDTPGGWAMIFGTEQGALKLTGNGRLFLSRNGGQWTAEPLPNEGGPATPLVRLITDFSEACQTDREPEVAVIDGMAGIALTLGAVASAREGRIAQLVKPSDHWELDRAWVLQQRRKCAGRGNRNAK